MPGVGHRARPLIESARHVASQRGVGGERNTIDAGEQRVAQIGDGPGCRRLGLQLHAFGGLAHDRIDHRADDRNRHSVSRAQFDGGDRGWHHRCDLVERRTTDVRRNPAQRRICAVTVAASSDAHAGHDRAASSQPYAFHRRPTEPQQAGGDTIGCGVATHRDEPTKRAPHRDGQRLCLHTVGESNTGVNFPAMRRPIHGLQSIGERIIVRRLGAATRSPDDDPPLGPRGLQLHVARLEVLP